MREKPATYLRGRKLPPVPPHMRPRTPCFCHTTVSGPELHAPLCNQPTNSAPLRTLPALPQLWRQRNSGSPGTSLCALWVCAREFHRVVGRWTNLDSSPVLPVCAVSTQAGDSTPWDWFSPQQTEGKEGHMNQCLVDI